MGGAPGLPYYSLDFIYLPALAIIVVASVISDVRVMSAGISDWMSAGLPVDSGS